MGTGYWVWRGVCSGHRFSLLGTEKNNSPLLAEGKWGQDPIPVCRSEVCAKLNDCMVRYMKKHLAFEDETEELE